MSKKIVWLKYLQQTLTYLPSTSIEPQNIALTAALSRLQKNTVHLYEQGTIHTDNILKSIRCYHRSLSCMVQQQTPPALMMIVYLVVASFVGEVNATPVTVTPDDVNRLVGGVKANTHYSTLFSTHVSGPQKTLVKTTNATFNAALAATLGALGTGEQYQINSAILSVGNSGDEYAPGGGAKGAYVVLTPYDNTTVTWNSFGGGGVAGTNYNATSSATGIINGANDTTTWVLTTVVRNFLNGTIQNEGLFFADPSGSSGVMDSTDKTTVVWNLDAQRIGAPIASVVSVAPVRVPVSNVWFLPGTGLAIALLAGIGVRLSRSRRKKNKASVE